MPCNPRVSYLDTDDKLQKVKDQGGVRMQHLAALQAVPVHQQQTGLLVVIPKLTTLRQHLIETLAKPLRQAQPTA